MQPGHALNVPVRTNASTGATATSGLGLAMAERAAKTDGATIRLEDLQGAPDLCVVVESKARCAWWMLSHIGPTLTKCSVSSRYMARHDEGGVATGPHRWKNAEPLFIAHYQGATIFCYIMFPK